MELALGRRPDCGGSASGAGIASRGADRHSGADVRLGEEHAVLEGVAWGTGDGGCGLEGAFAAFLRGVVE